MTGQGGFIPLTRLLSLKGRRALVTGAASGIGEAISLRLAEAGADLYLVDINEEGLERVRDRVKELFNVGVEAFRVDLSVKKEIDDLWEELKGREPDILVNNAGVYLFHDFLEVDEELLEKTLAVNLKSAFWMSQHMIKSRGNRGGIIINIGSIEAIIPLARGLVHYDISKMGIIALTRTLAKEYGRRDFRVNAVIPGGIKTPGVEKLKREAILKLKIDLIKTGIEFLNRLPLGRFGTPDEVARIVLILATDITSYVNGAIIPVDGGFLAA